MGTKKKPRGPGRPRSATGERRHLAVYVLPEEHDAIVAAAVAAEEPSTSSWAAKVLTREAGKRAQG